MSSNSEHRTVAVNAGSEAGAISPDSATLSGRQGASTQPQERHATRDASADDRDARDVAADERDHEADRREAEADRRDREADARERDADAREAALEDLSRTIGLQPEDTRVCSGGADDRASAQAARAEGCADRWRQALSRHRARIAREQGRVDRKSTAVSDRAVRAGDDAQRLAARLASTADHVASTLDRVARTREARVNQADGAEVGARREAAQRAREKADGERREGRELRATWDLSQG